MHFIPFVPPWRLMHLIILNPGLKYITDGYCILDATACSEIQIDIARTKESKERKESNETKRSFVLRTSSRIELSKEAAAKLSC